ncbi:MAG: hypothetical protein DIU78_015980, partial [Pseudomonadota bacterium]
MRPLFPLHHRIVRIWVWVLLALWAPAALAAPEARILRIDPRAAEQNQNPVLTTVIDIAQSKRVSEA